MILTLLSVVVAFLLFGLLDTVRGTFESYGQSVAGRDRLVTFEKRYRPLPLSLYTQIKEVPGVVEVERGFDIGATYRDPKNFFYIETVTPNRYTLYPELDIAPEVREALQHMRTGAIAGEALVRRYNWKAGDRIPLQTELARQDGSTTWTFDVVGTYRFKDVGMKVYENQLFVNEDYVEEARATDKGMTSWYAVKVADPLQMDRVARAVDALSANSGHESKTQSENASSAGLIGRFGDLGRVVTSVMGAVFFTLLLLTGHTMTQAVYERIPEMAVLKTIGFSGKSIMALILSESVLLLLLGALIGLVLATFTTLGVRSAVGTLIPDTLPIPIMPVGIDVWLRGLLGAVLVGVMVGLLPAHRGWRLRIVDALSDR